MRYLLMVLLWLVPVIGSGADEVADAQPVPPLTGPVVDLTHTLSDAERQQIETRIRQLAEERGSQIQVLIVPTTRPEAIEQYSIRVVEQWKLGRQSIDDGVLLLVAKDDRRMRIEVGYGLEGAIPDAIAKRIISEIIAPRFRRGEFAQGILAGVDQLARLIEGEQLPPPRRGQDRRTSDRLDGFLPIIFFFAIFFGPVARSLFGRLPGAGLAAAIAGGGFWLMTAATVASLLVAFIVFVVVLIFSGGGRSSFPGNRGGYGGGFGGNWPGGMGGGGGWSGGGGGFGGGGASGGW